MGLTPLSSNEPAFQARLFIACAKDKNEVKGNRRPQCKNYSQWQTPVVPALDGQEQGDWSSRPLSYIARPHVKTEQLQL